jgi:hypothetical protein
VIYKASFIASKLGKTSVCTMHLRSADVDWWETFDTDNPDPLDVANELDTQFRTLWLNLLHTSWTFDRIAVTTVTQPGNPGQVPRAAEKAIGVAGARPGSNTDLPDPMCGLLSIKTGLAGRSFRGRMFLPPIEVSGEVIGDLLSSAGNYSTAVAAFQTKLTNSFGGGSTFSTLWQDTWHMRIGIYSPTRHRQGFNPWFSNATSTRYDRSVHWLRSRVK